MFLEIVQKTYLNFLLPVKHTISSKDLSYILQKSNYVLHRLMSQKNLLTFSWYGWFIQRFFRHSLNYQLAVVFANVSDSTPIIVYRDAIKVPFLLSLQIVDLLFFILLIAVFLIGYGVVQQVLLHPNSSPSWNILKNVLNEPYFSLYTQINLQELQGIRAYWTCTYDIFSAYRVVVSSTEQDTNASPMADK